jgi:two-component system chemotaxis response regulator CheY
MRALIVDDSKIMRRVLAAVLKQIGFEVAEASNGREGLDLLEDPGALDLALVDWNMPIMDGLAFVHAVRSEPRFRALPLVMVTTESDPGQVAKALEAGANEYVMKPFTKEVIVEKLNLLGLVQCRPEGDPCTP